MQFELDIGGRVRRVRVARREAGLEVDVDGRIFVVDPRPVGRDGLSMLVRDGDGRARSIDAVVTAREGTGGFDVSIEGHTLKATRVSRFGRRPGDGPGHGGGPQHVTAPMPGKVVKVLVAAGDQVTLRQGLVVIEAMKMENELRAGRTGRVTAVRVAEGQSVEAGAPLVTVE